MLKTLLGIETIGITANEEWPFSSKMLKTLLGIETQFG
jgi:hypothetical protein